MLTRREHLRASLSLSLPLRNYAPSLSLSRARRGIYIEWPGPLRSRERERGRLHISRSTYVRVRRDAAAAKAGGKRNLLRKRLLAHRPGEEEEEERTGYALSGVYMRRGALDSEVSRPRSSHTYTRASGGADAALAAVALSLSRVRARLPVCLGSWITLLFREGLPARTECARALQGPVLHRAREMLSASSFCAS